MTHRWGTRRVRITGGLLAAAGVLGSLLVAPAVGAATETVPACTVWDARQGDTVRLSATADAVVDVVNQVGTDCRTGAADVTFSTVRLGQAATGTEVRARFEGRTATITSGTFALDHALYDHDLVIDPAKPIVARTDGAALKLTSGSLIPKADEPTEGAGVPSADGTAPRLRPQALSGALSRALAARVTADESILPDVLAALATGAVTVEFGITEWGFSVDLWVGPPRVRVWGILAWDNSYRLNVAIKDLPLGDPALGQGRLNATGVISGPNLDVDPTYSITGTLTGPLGLSPEFTVLGGTARITNEAITITGNARLRCRSGAVTLAATVTYRSEQDWSATSNGTIGTEGCALADGITLSNGELNARLSGGPDGTTSGTVQVNGAARVAALPSGLQDWRLTLNGTLTGSPTGVTVAGEVDLRADAARLTGTLAADGTLALNANATVAAFGGTTTVAGRVTGTLTGPRLDLSGDLAVNVTAAGRTARLAGRATLDASGTTLAGTLSLPCDTPSTGSVVLSLDLPAAAAGATVVDVAGRTEGDCRLGGLTVSNAAVSGRATFSGGNVDLLGTLDIAVDGRRITGSISSDATGLRVEGGTTLPCLTGAIGLGLLAFRDQATVTGTVGPEGCVLTPGLALTPGEAVTGTLTNGDTGLRATFAVTGTATADWLPRGSTGWRFAAEIGGAGTAGAKVSLTSDLGRLDGTLDGTGGVDVVGSVKVNVNGRRVDAATRITRRGNGPVETSLTGSVEDTAAGMRLNGGVTGTASGLRFVGTATLPCGDGSPAPGSITANVDAPVAADGSWSATVAATATTCPLGPDATITSGTFLGTLSSNGTFSLKGDAAMRFGNGTVNASATIARSAGDAAPSLTATATLNPTVGPGADQVRLTGRLTWNATGLRVAGTATVGCIQGDIETAVTQAGAWSATLAGGTVAEGCPVAGSSTTIVGGTVAGTIRSDGTYALSGDLRLQFAGTTYSAGATVSVPTPGAGVQLEARAAVANATAGVSASGSFVWSATGVRFVGSAAVPCVNASVDVPVAADGSWAVTVAGAVVAAGCRLDGNTVFESASLSGTIASNGTWRLAGGSRLRFGATAVAANLAVAVPTPGAAPVVTAEGAFDTTTGGTRVAGSLRWTAAGLRLTGSATLPCAAGSVTGTVDTAVDATGVWSATLAGTIGSGGCRLGEAEINSGAATGTINSDGSFRLQGAVRLRFGTSEVSANATIARAVGGAATVTAGAGIDIISNGVRLAGTVNWSAAGLRLTGTATVPCSAGSLTASLNGSAVSSSDWSAGVNLTTAGSCRISANATLNSATLSGTLVSRAGVLTLGASGAAQITTASNLVPYSGNTYAGGFSLNAAGGTVTGHVSVGGSGVILTGAISWSGAMNWSVSASGRLQVRGASLGFSGTVSSSGSNLAWNLSGSVNGSIQLSSNLWVDGGSFRWNNSRFDFNGSLRVACTSGDLRMNGSGWIMNNNNWRFDLSTSSNGCRLGRNLQLSNSPFNAWLQSSNGSVNGEISAGFSRWEPQSDVWVTNGSLRLRIVDGWRYSGRVEADGGARLRLFILTHELGARVALDFNLDGRGTGNVRATVSNIRIGFVSLCFRVSLEARLRDGSVHGLSL